MKWQQKQRLLLTVIMSRHRQLMQLFLMMVSAKTFQYRVILMEIFAGRKHILQINDYLTGAEPRPIRDLDATPTQNPQYIPMQYGCPVAFLISFTTIGDCGEDIVKGGTIIILNDKPLKFTIHDEYKDVIVENDGYYATDKSDVLTNYIFI